MLYWINISLTNIYNYYLNSNDSTTISLASTLISFILDNYLINSNHDTTIKLNLDERGNKNYYMNIYLYSNGSIY